MEEQIQNKGQVLIINMPERLDVSNSTKMEKIINNNIDNGKKYMLLDMSGVEYISSSGLRIFISTLRRIRDLNGKLKISGMKDRVKKVFIMVELYDLLDDYPTLEHALKSFGELAE